MKWFFYSISILFITAGSTLILYSNGMRTFLQKIGRGRNAKMLFPLPLLVGGLFILFKDVIIHAWLATVLGVLGVVKGVLLLLSPPHYIETTIKWWTGEVQDITYRFWGIIVLILGITLLSWIR